MVLLMGSKPAYKKKKSVPDQVETIASALESGNSNEKQFASWLKNGLKVEWGPNATGELIVPKSQKKKVEALVDALRAQGHDVSLKDSKDGGGRVLVVTGKKIGEKNVEAELDELVGSGTKSAEEAPAPPAATIPKKADGPPALEEHEKNLLGMYSNFNRGDAQKLRMIREGAKGITEGSARSDLVEFDLLYRATYDRWREMNADSKKAQRIKAGLDSLHSTWVEVAGRLLDEEVQPRPKPIPVKQKPRPPKAAKKPTQLSKLRELLSKEPLNEEAKKAHFADLLRVYQDSKFMNKFSASFRDLQSLNAQMKAITNPAEKRKASERIRNIEGAIATYQQLHLQLLAYGRNIGDRKQQEAVADASKKIKFHNEMFKHKNSESLLMGEINSARLGKDAYVTPTRAYLHGRLKADSPGQTIDMGANKADAQQLAKILTQYPQLMLDSGTVRVATYYKKGKPQYRVELGTPEACAMERAMKANLDGDDIPISPAEGTAFRDGLDNLFAQGVNDTFMTAKPYGKAYEQIRALGVGGKERYNIMFPNAIAAGIFYNLIANYGAAHGFSPVGTAKKVRGGVMVSVKCPAYASAEQLGSGDVLSTPSLSATEPKEEKEVPTPAPVKGTLSLKLSKEAMKAMGDADPRTFEAAYSKSADKYGALLASLKEKSGAVSIDDIKALAAAAQECADLTGRQLEQLTAHRSWFDSQFAEEIDAYDTYTASIEKQNNANLVDLDKIKANLAARQQTSPEDIAAIPVEIPTARGMRSSHLTLEEGKEAISAYHTQGASWKHTFKNKRYLRHVVAYLTSYNFEVSRLKVSKNGKTLTISGPSSAAAAREAGAGEGMEFTISEEARAQIEDIKKETIKRVPGGMGDFLQDGNRRVVSGRSNLQVLEAFAAQVSVEQLETILNHIVDESHALAYNLPSPGGKLSLDLTREADITAVMDGIRLLYVAAGFDLPRFAPVRVSPSSGAKRIRVLGLPQEYVRPSPKFALPEPDEDGYVVLNGTEIYLPMEQKQEVESALKEGKAFEAVIMKGPESRQVDTAGAYALRDYLLERGWAHVGLKNWDPERRGSATAKVYAEEVPPGYWDRPVIGYVARAGAVMATADEIARLTEKRKEEEMDQLLLPGTGVFALPEDGVIKGEGSRLIALLDSPRKSLEDAEAKTPKERDYLGRHWRAEKKWIQSQKEQIESTVNTPGASCKISYRDGSRAYKAASYIEHYLRSRGDFRVVSVRRAARFKNLPTPGFYLEIGESPEDKTAFAQRYNFPISIPYGYVRYSAKDKADVPAEILNDARQREELQLFLNGRGGRRISFYTTEERAEPMRRYLDRMGFNMGNYMEEPIDPKDVPIEEKASLAGVPGKRVLVTIAIPRETTVADLSSDDPAYRSRMYEELNTKLLGAGEDDSAQYFLNYATRSPGVVDRLLTYAKNPRSLKKEYKIYFGRQDDGDREVLRGEVAGSRMAQDMYFALLESELFAPSGIELRVSNNKLTLLPAPPEVTYPMGARGPHTRRMEQAEKLDSAFLRGILLVKVAESADYASRLFRTEKKQKYDVTFELDAGNRLSTADHFHYVTGLQAKGEDAFTVNWNSYFGLASNLVHNTHTSAPKTTFVYGPQGLANLDMQASKKDAAKFDPDPATRVMEAFLQLHSGFGRRATEKDDEGTKRDWRMQRPRYWQRASEMREVFAKWDYDALKFFEELKFSDVGKAVAVAAYQYGSSMAEYVAQNNVNYASWDRKKQARFRKAVFNEAALSFVVTVLSETGSVLADTTKYNPRKADSPEEAAQRRKRKEEVLEDYRRLIIEDLTATADRSKFDYEGKTRFVLPSLVVTPSGANYVAVESKRKGMVLAVKGRVQKTNKFGNTVWLLEDMEPENMEIGQTDSLGPGGATPRHGGLVPTGDARITPIKDKPTGGVEKPREEERRRAGAFYPILSIPYTPYKRARSSTQIRLNDREVLLAFSVSRKELFKAEKDLRVGTLAVERVPVTLRNGESSEVMFLIPPRHRYDAKRQEEEEIDYNANPFEGLYAAAYAMGTDVYVFDYVEGKEPEEYADVPANARKYYAYSTAQLAKEGIMKVSIGTINKATGDISFAKDEYAEKYGPHFYGQVLLSDDMMKGAEDAGTEKEKAAFRTDVEEFLAGERPYLPGFNYYFLDPLDAGGTTQVVCGAGGTGTMQFFILPHKTETGGGTIPDRIKTKGGEIKVKMK